MNDGINLKLLWLLILLLFANVSFSQDKSAFIGIRAGASIPIGKYRSFDLEERSFALTGLNLTTEGAWFFHPNVGVGLSAALNLHPVEVSRLGWELLQDDPSMEDMTIRSEPFQIITAMGGIYSRIPISGKFSVVGKLLGGLLYGKTPYQLYKPEFFMVGRVYYEITSAKDWKFSWQAGVGLQYDISPCFVLLFDTELMYDKLEFGFKTYKDIRTEVKTISFTTTTLGIRFKI